MNNANENSTIIEIAHKDNTVEIDPKLCQMLEFKESIINDAGFELIHVNVISEVPINKIDEGFDVLPNGFKVRKSRRIKMVYKTQFIEYDFDNTLRYLHRYDPKAAWNIRHIVIKDTHNIYKFQSSQVHGAKRMLLNQRNNVNYDKINIEMLRKELANLYYVSCSITPPQERKQKVCNSHIKLDKELGYNRPVKPRANAKK